MPGAVRGPVPLYNLDDIPALNPRVGCVQRVFRGSGVCVCLSEVHPNMTPKPESLPWEQLFVLLEGRLKLHVGNQVLDMKQGSFVRIPPNVVHYAEPPLPEDGIARNLDVFPPTAPEHFEFTSYQTDDFDTDRNP